MRSIHTIKTTIISFHIEFVVSIHNIISFNYDYIFKSDEIDFSIYVHVLNANTKVILIKNDINIVLKISRNFRFEKLIEMNNSNVYLMNFNIISLTLKRSKFKHKNLWFNKILYTYIVVNDNFNIFTNTVLFNDVTISNSINDTVKVFVKLIHEFFFCELIKNSSIFRNKIEWKYL